MSLLGNTGALQPDPEGWLGQFWSSSQGRVVHSQTHAFLAGKAKPGSLPSPRLRSGRPDAVSPVHLAPA